MENIDVPDQHANEQTFQKKSQYEHILLRPDTYVGSTVKETQLRFVFDEERQRIIQKYVTFVPALYKIFDEILVNATDNRHRDRSMNELKVNIDVAEGSISVYNNGQGIPVEMYEDEKVYIPELMFGHLLTSSNYDDSQKKTTGGRNGYGAKLTNIFSTRFEIETSHSKSGKKYKQVWYNNMSKMDAPKLSKSKKDYTSVKFIPDFKRFKMLGLDEDIISIIKKRVYDIAGTAPEDLKVYINDVRLKIKSFKKYVSLYIKDSNKIIFDKPNGLWEIGICASDGHFQQVSFVNNIATIKGGTHVKHVTDQIINGLLERLEKHLVYMDIKPHHIKNNLWVFVNSFIENPAFDSQTKKTNSTREEDFGSECIISSKFIDKIFNDTKVISNCFEWFQAQNVSINNIEKLEDANEAGKNNRNPCTLIITEGDSAKAFAVSGLSVVGRDHYGVYPLRGKLLNVCEAKVSKIKKNEQIIALTNILGLKFGAEYNDTTTLRYDHLMIMTDQDHDGSHIKGLVINYLHTFWPSLLKIDGFLNMFITPIVKCTYNDVILQFYTLPEYEEWKKLNNDYTNWDIIYYKGLGTSEPTDAYNAFSDLERHKLDIIWDDDNDANDAIHLAFSKEMADNRKEWMRSCQMGTEIIIKYMNIKNVTIADFINNDLRLYYIASNERAIPSMIDGLKPGQRKILFTGFKKKINKEIKVTTFSGLVCQIAAYHHGDASLNQTIIKLAQNFVGSNNINLLIPAGHFGTRAMGGKDHSAARYLFTYISKLARYIFHENDDGILDYLDGDGRIIEPKFYIPILPLVLVNGCQGIGTGWSTMVLSYNPREIVNNLLLLINGKPMIRMHPYFKNWGGVIEEIGYKKYLIKGIVEEIDDITVNITELPIGTTIVEYKEDLEALIGLKHIKEFSQHHNYNNIHFVIKLSTKKLNEAKKTGLTKFFRLEKTLSLNNMVLFDAEGNLKKYNNANQILKEFYTLRLAKYKERKEYLAQKLTDELTILRNKVRFISAVISGEFIVSKREKVDLLNQLINDEYAAYPKTKLNNHKNNNTDDDDSSSNSFSDDDDDDNMQNDSTAKDYHYLLRMPLWSLTKERVDKLILKKEQKEEELEILIETDIKEMWRNDLDDFSNCLNEVEAEELSAINNSIKNKTKNIIKRRKINYINTNHLVQRKEQTVIDMTEVERISAKKNNKKNNKKTKQLLMPPTKTNNTSNSTKSSKSSNSKSNKKTIIQNVLDFNKESVNDDDDDDVKEEDENTDESSDDELSLMERLAKKNKLSKAKSSSKNSTTTKVNTTTKKKTTTAKAASKKKKVVNEESDEDDDLDSDFDSDFDDDDIFTTPIAKRTTSRRKAAVRRKSIIISDDDDDDDDEEEEEDLRDVFSDSENKEEEKAPTQKKKTTHKLGPKTTKKNNNKRTVTARKATDTNNLNVTRAPKRSRKYTATMDDDDDYSVEVDEEDFQIFYGEKEEETAPTQKKKTTRMLGPKTTTKKNNKRTVTARKATDTNNLNVTRAPKRSRKYTATMDDDDDYSVEVDEEDFQIFYGEKEEEKAPTNHFLTRKEQTVIEMTEAERISALIKACYDGRLEDVECIIDQCKAYININNALIGAIQGGHLDIVQYLVNKCKADINITNNNGWNALMLACAHGQIDIVRYLIQECKADISITDSYGWNALMLACSQGHLDIVNYLIQECKADINITDINNGSNALLMKAFSNGHLDIVQYLVNKCKADINITDNNGLTILMKACKNGHLDKLKILVEECKADINITNNYGKNALLFALSFGHLDIVQYLVNKCKADINHSDNTGHNALMFACIIGRLDIVKYLTEDCKAEINITKNNNGWNALMLACAHGQIDIVRYLIQECKADISITDSYGWNALMLACAHGQIDIVRYLIKECKADINITDINNGWNALLMKAYSKGHLDIVRYLIKECKADIIITDNNGLNLVMKACTNGHLLLLKILVEECKADINITDIKNGSNALMIACMNGHLNIVKYLIKTCNADINNIDIYGTNVLMKACVYGHLAIVRYLIKECKADINITNNNGLNALMFACMNGHLNIVKYLVEECNADVNFVNIEGNKAIYYSIENNHFQIVVYLETIQKISNDELNQLIKLATEKYGAPEAIC